MSAVTRTPPVTTTQVYQIFIRATAEQIWEGITDPGFTVRYFHGARHEYANGRRLSRGPDGELYGDTEVLEFDPPRRLVHAWRSLYNAELAAEPESRVTWEITPQEGGPCLLTVVHDRLERSPKTAERVSGAGWMMVLSGLKTLLETGESLTTPGSLRYSQAAEPAA